VRRIEDCTMRIVAHFFVEPARLGQQAVTVKAIVCILASLALQENFVGEQVQPPVLPI